MEKVYEMSEFQNGGRPAARSTRIPAVCYPQNFCVQDWPMVFLLFYWIVVEIGIKLILAEGKLLIGLSYYPCRT